MMPTFTTPLNDRLIMVMIEEHQAEIRRCFAPRPDAGRFAPVALLQRLGILRRRNGEVSAHQGTALTAQEIV